MHTDPPAVPSITSTVPAGSEQRACPPKTIPTECLFQGCQEILVGHNGETYRLRITKNDKLILTK